MDPDELNSRVFQMEQERNKIILKAKLGHAREIIKKPDAEASNVVKSNAYYDLYLFHRYGWGEAEQNGERATKYLIKSANLDAGNTRAKNDLMRLTSQPR